MKKNTLILFVLVFCCAELFGEHSDSNSNPPLGSSGMNGPNP